MTLDFCNSADRLVSHIPDGASVALLFGPGSPLEIARALVRRQVRNLHLITVPTGDIAADLLIGAGCVQSVETSGISLGEFGSAPNFVSGVRSGTLTIRDTTCPAVYSGLQAAQKGIPFIPVRGLLGSDILANRPDYKIIDNPYGTNDPIVLVPAIRPDFALIHVARADHSGDLYIGNRPEVRMLAAAAHATLATAEKITAEPIAVDPLLAPACLSSLYVTAIAPAPRGAWPSEMPGLYAQDADHIADYSRRAGNPDEFEAYLAEMVRTPNRIAG